MMNATVRYPGAKWSLAIWIIGHFPEPYCVPSIAFERASAQEVRKALKKKEGAT